MSDVEEKLRAELNHLKAYMKAMGLSAADAPKIPLDVYHCNNKIGEVAAYMEKLDERVTRLELLIGSDGK